MIDIRFNTGRGDQAIYTGVCDCGNVIAFTPGKDCTCICGKRWITGITTAVDVSQQTVKPVSKKAGPSERKSKAIV